MLEQTMLLVVILFELSFKFYKFHQLISGTQNHSREPYGTLVSRIFHEVPVIPQEIEIQTKKC